MSTREEKIDQLTREKIAKEMNVPADMVSKTTDMYKKTYAQFEKSVPENYTSTNDDNNKDLPKKIIPERNHLINKSKFYKRNSKPTINDDVSSSSDISDNDVDNDDNGDDNKSIPGNQDKQFAFNKKKSNFFIKGKPKKRKLHWLDLPDSDELEEYSNCNSVCKNLVKMYNKRYKEVELQIKELQEIVNDIDKYSNYEN